MKNILIIQTAFLGDLILTLPMTQVLSRSFPQAEIDMLVIPSTAEVLKHSPFVREAIVYDKRESGIGGLMNIGSRLRSKKYDVLISPHRSSRSALISKLANAGMSISFDKSSMNFLYDKTVSYKKGVHEIQRNLSLLEPLGIFETNIIPPVIFTGEDDRNAVDEFLTKKDLAMKRFVTIAPGAVWFTKKFPAEKFVSVIKLLNNKGIKTVLVGGKNDLQLCLNIASEADPQLIFNTAGEFSILRSSELIRRSSLLICNDSAPLHIGNAVGTPVFSIFGSTIPGFGFYPYGSHDKVFEVSNLPCRPCGIHGRMKCPLGTLECLNSIDEGRIAESAVRLLSET